MSFPDFVQIQAAIVIFAEIYLIHYFIKKVWEGKLTIEIAIFAMLASICVLGIDAVIFGGIGTENELIFSAGTFLACYLNMNKLVDSLQKLEIIQK